MKYTYATLLLHETGAEINEQNLTNVLEAARADEVTTSRIKALVAALEDVDISEYAAAATPATVDDAPDDQASDAATGEGEASADDGTGLVFGEDDGDDEDGDEEREGEASEEGDDEGDEERGDQ